MKAGHIQSARVTIDCDGDYAAVEHSKAIKDDLGLQV
jgi:hypothetical protein